MDARILTRARSLIVESTGLCAAADRLRKQARLVRARVGREVRRCAARRMARLASGASAEPAKRSETLRCPVCLSEYVRLDSMTRLVRAVYQCEACGMVFLHVRKPRES
jgi:predicted RNA-binding Zn-ribbon protein involved in translation (DUF1610 family)